jgi:uncharacterized protein
MEPLMVKHIVFTTLIFLSFYIGYGIFYSAWWQFIPSTFFILLLTKQLYPQQWKKYLGLVGSLKDLILAVLIGTIFGVVSYYVIKNCLPGNYILGRENFWKYLSFITNLFQTLNEEMLFRALLLNSLLYVGFGKWKTVLVPALMFSLLHWFFYMFNYSLDVRGALNLSSLITIFLFSFSMGLIFIKTKSIFIPWALHYGWNFNRFSMGVVELGNPGERIPEYLSFNLIEGSGVVVVLCIVFSFLIYIFYK